MDFSSSFKRSVSKPSSRISTDNHDSHYHQEQQLLVLSDYNKDTNAATPATDHATTMPSSSINHHLIVKIDGCDPNNKNISDEVTSQCNVNNSRIWRESSHDIDEEVALHPASKIKGQILNNQMHESLEACHQHDNSSGSCAACLNFPPTGARYQSTPYHNKYSTPRKLEVPIQPQAPQLNDRVVVVAPDESHEGPQEYQSRRTSNADNEKVLRGTKIQHRPSALGRLKTKSRLMDPSPERPQDRPSVMLRKPREEEEDDPFMEEDLPDEYRKRKINLLILVQWISLVLILTALTSTLALRKWKARKIRGLNLWKWEVLVLVLICGRLVSGWVIRIVVFFIERNFLLRKRVLYFVYGVRKAVQNCCWLGLVLIAWHNMFDKKVEGNNKFLQYVNKLMVCMLLATVLWLVKTLMVKVLASSFHVSAFFDRIQDSLFNQYVIKALSGPPLTEIQSSQEQHDRMTAEVGNFQKDGATLPSGLRRGLSRKPSAQLSFKISAPIHKKQSDPGITVDHLHRLNPKNVSAWGMKRLMNIIRYGSLSTLEEQIMESAKYDESATEIRSEYEAKVAARKIFRTVAKPGSKFIYLEDLMRFLREEEALKTMNFVEESSESEKISKSSLKNWVVNAFRERKSLALTLNDTKTAVKNLHQMANVLVGIIIVIISLITLGILTSQFILFLSSQIVVVAFIFGNTCKTVFESIIFLFVIHPFDVGDRCEIDGVQMIVEEINILSTVFLRYDNQKIVYPNSTLSTKPIHNYYRSPDMSESVDFLVHIATPPEKINMMKKRIVSYIESKKDHWYSNSSVVLMNLEDLQKLRMSVWIAHKMNHQDMKERWLRRALLVEEMIKIFRELDVEYRLRPLDINIRTMPPHLNSDRVPSTWRTSATE